MQEQDPRGRVRRDGPLDRSVPVDFPVGGISFTTAVSRQRAFVSGRNLIKHLSRELLEQRILQRAIGIEGRDAGPCGELCVQVLDVPSLQIGLRSALLNKQDKDQKQAGRDAITHQPKTVPDNSSSRPSPQSARGCDHLRGIRHHRSIVWRRKISQS